MTTHDHDSAGTDVATAERSGQLNRFENPGLPEHRHRVTDVDPRAAKRAERQVAALFGLSVLGTIFTIVAYFAVQIQGDYSMDVMLRRVLLSNVLLGLGLFVALIAIGVGAVHWAKTLMPDEERIELRHDLRGSDEDRADAVALLKEGAAEAGLGRRPLIRNSLIGALALFPLPAIVLLRDTGPLPGKALSETPWKKGVRVVRDQIDGAPLKASDLELGSVVHAMPEGVDKMAHPLEERAKSAVILMRLDPKILSAETGAKGYYGIVAFSKICTHMGCPVGLYEQQTHHLLCPCHQSTFDVPNGCEVIFGPAKRPLPQLPITVDSDGYLVAADGFNQPVGPSFFERG